MHVLCPPSQSSESDESHPPAHGLTDDGMNPNRSAEGREKREKKMRWNRAACVLGSRCCSAGVV
jgi:hypothetical protein